MVLSACTEVPVQHSYGNTFLWDYTLQLKPGNALTRVGMHHWMYLAGDGNTHFDQVTIRKFGRRMAGTTEYFQPGAAVMPGIGTP